MSNVRYSESKTQDSKSKFMVYRKRTSSLTLASLTKMWSWRKPTVNYKMISGDEPATRDVMRHWTG